MPEKGGIVLKRRLLLVWILIAALMLSGGACFAREAIPFDEYVRFHVIAEDDSPEAQALKLRVRDGVIGKVRALLADCTDGDGAWRVALENIGRIETWAVEAAHENGYAGAVKARADMVYFPEREYGGVTVPAGRYRTVRIVLGGGAGQNWWCVLYPSICMPEGYEPGMKVEFYSGVLRWIKSVFGGIVNE